ncbi:adenylyl-sulfate kinase [Massilia sp. TS11]|uniref:adenylyl-sulfate kinase n=1 Tax=Massilia sp. TS11 TaxID=2908003 RepID=UPI001EDC5161|nr:adenylyl-sulfate kinase [Massilia sp. TS11]MCG2582815.1 adenylyl-sulfate kinase [Massilia sp. TS11]
MNYSTTQPKGLVIWLTGLSGAGKSTLALQLQAQLRARGHASVILDGDDMRDRLCKDLGFSREDRMENVRRAGEIARLVAQSGVHAIVALVSPYQAARDQVRALMPAGEFLEVFCACPLDVCAKRDVKGLYRRAQAGGIANFTGVSDPYEAPAAPELVLNSAVESVDESLARLLALIEARLD